jgi:hypothetical protein
MECSGCNGLNDIVLGPVQYQETQGGAARGILNLPLTPQTQNGTIIDGQLVGGTIATRVIAAAGQMFLWNSDQFPVTAGAQFQLAIPGGTIGGLGWFGYVGVVWITSAGVDMIPRFTITPPPGKALMSTAVTAADGTFQLPKMPRESFRKNPVTVEFNGLNGTYRGAVWSPTH